MQTAVYVLVALGLSMPAPASRADPTATGVATTATPVRFTVELDARFAKEPLKLSRLGGSRSPRFIGTLRNVSSRVITVTQSDTSITVHSLAANGHPLASRTAPESDNRMVSWIAHEDSRLVELAPGGSMTIEFWCVDDRLQLTDGRNQRAVRYDLTEPGKYEVSFDYRYHRAATSQRGERGFVGAARSNSVTSGAVR